MGSISTTSLNLLHSSPLLPGRRPDHILRSLETLRSDAIHAVNTVHAARTVPAVFAVVAARTILAVIAVVAGDAVLTTVAVLAHNAISITVFIAAIER